MNNKFKKILLSITLIISILLVVFFKKTYKEASSPHLGTEVSNYDYGFKIVVPKGWSITESSTNNELGGKQYTFVDSSKGLPLIFLIISRKVSGKRALDYFNESYPYNISKDDKVRCLSEIEEVRFSKFHCISWSGMQLVHFASDKYTFIFEPYEFVPPPKNVIQQEQYNGLVSSFELIPESEY